MWHYMSAREPAIVSRRPAYGTGLWANWRRKGSVDIVVERAEVWCSTELHGVVKCSTVRADSIGPVCVLAFTSRRGVGVLNNVCWTCAE
jgi:hypothetical protein